MSLKSLTYTSLAAIDLKPDDLEAIHRTARDINALEGVTGMLIYNGIHFLQVIEGAPNAIDDLVERLRRDPRHSGLEIRDEHEIEERSFPSWSMELVRVSVSYFEARDTIIDRMPQDIAAQLRDRVIQMTEEISSS
jgi:hypothetical protein